MICKKIHWKPSDTKENNIKLRVLIHLVNATVCKPYEDVNISFKTKLHNEFSFQEMTKLVDGCDTKDATNHFLLITYLYC